MPAETAEEVAAEQSLDAKLAAFFEAEQAEAADTPVEGPASADEHVEETPEAEERPRDEKGRFAPAPTEEPEPPEEAPAEELLLAGKYKSPQELEAAYKQLESRLGTQGQELGDLRQQIEESMDEKLDRFQQSAAQNQFSYNAPALIQAAVDEGRYQEAALYALQTENQVLYNQVLGEWSSAEPYPAYAFDNQLRQNALLQAVENRLASVSKPLAQREMERAAAEYAADKPDWAQVAPEMMKVAEESQHILQLLESPDPKVRVEVLDYLYTKARGRQSDTLTAAKQTAAAETLAAAREAKTQATVGTPATQSQAKPKTEQDKWRDEFRKVLFDESTSIRSGLTKDE